MDTVSRRDFLAGGALLLTARSYSRIVGANDRIQIGLIGCGHRSEGHRQMLKMSAATDPNFEVRSVCDLWSVNRERAADHVQRLFGKSVLTRSRSPAGPRCTFDLTLVRSVMCRDNSRQENSIWRSQPLSYLWRPQDISLPFLGQSLAFQQLVR